MQHTNDSLRRVTSSAVNAGSGSKGSTVSAAHTPEPWFAVNVGSEREPMWSVKAARIAGKPPKHGVALCATGDSPQEMETANAARIVQCINACAGMDDPAAEIARMRDISINGEVVSRGQFVELRAQVQELAGALRELVEVVQLTNGIGFFSRIPENADGPLPTAIKVLAKLESGK